MLCEGHTFYFLYVVRTEIESAYISRSFIDSDIQPDRLCPEIEPFFPFYFFML